MLLDGKNSTRKYVDEYFANNRIETNQILEVTSMDLLIEFAKTSLGVAGVIKEFVKDELDNKKLFEIPLDKALEKRNIGFIYDLNVPMNIGSERFINFYKDIWLDIYI